jgi:hypothetical protein
MGLPCSRNAPEPIALDVRYVDQVNCERPDSGHPDCRHVRVSPENYSLPVSYLAADGVDQGLAKDQAQARSC